MAALAFPINRPVDTNGLTMSGAKAYFYATGGLNPLAVYTTADLDVAHTNPVVADAGGLFPSVFLDPTRSYRLILQTAAGIEIADVDPVASQDSSPHVSVTGFGAVGDGVTDDTAEIQAAIDYIDTRGGGELYLPNGTYKVTQLTDCDNLTLTGPGATITSSATTGVPTLSISHSGVTVDGIRFVLTGASVLDPWHLNVTGPNCTIQNCELVKDEGASGYQAYIRWGADGLRWINNKTSGSNGVYHEASNFLYEGSNFIARVTGGDDALVLKAIQGVVHTGRIVSCHFENHSDMVAFGSEIGTAGANDPTFSKGVRGIVIDGCTAKNCSYPLFIKPGGGGGDYRNGFVRDITFSNIVIEDMTGAKFERGIAITPGRGALVDTIIISNVTIRGRVTGTEATGHKRLIGILNQDMGVGTAPTIKNITIDGVHFTDPYGGAAFGTAGTAGYPIINLLSVADNIAGGGNISNIRVTSLEGNGCAEYAVNISSNNNNAVTIDRLKSSNSVGGIFADSAYALGEYSISLASGSTFAGSGAVNPKLPVQIAASSFVANATGARADATALPVAQAKALLAVGGIGYATGVGGAVTQATSKATGVTLDKVSGQITTHNAALASAALVTFTVTNSEVAATDTIELNLVSGQATEGTYRYWVEKVAAGSFKVTIENRSAGSLSEALVFNFALIKAVAA